MICFHRVPPTLPSPLLPGAPFTRQQKDRRKAVFLCFGGQILIPASQREPRIKSLPLFYKGRQTGGQVVRPYDDSSIQRPFVQLEQGGDLAAEGGVVGGLEAGVGLQQRLGGALGFVQRAGVAA